MDRTRSRILIHSRFVPGARAAGQMLLALALGALLGSCSPLPVTAPVGARAIQPSPLAPQESWKSTGFDPQQSVGVFVGVRRFSEDTQLAEVPYAVDDAVDLAYLFSLELGLVAPSRVRLLISGEAQKPETRKRLRTLEQADARVETATQSAIYNVIDQDTRMAGPQGLLILSFATHGFSSEGAHYLMAKDSLLRRVKNTALPSPHVLEAVGEVKEVPRRIILLDACRQRLVNLRSRGIPDHRSAVPTVLTNAIAKTHGQVVLSAARLGGYAFDDPKRRNGVFTGAILDGLRCTTAQRDDRNFVTVETLASYVDREVIEWVKKNRLSSDWEPGIERTLSGPVLGLPLVTCGPVARSSRFTVGIVDITRNKYIRGEVANLSNPQDFKIAVYIFTDRWHIHPYANQGEGMSWTAISTDGAWKIPTVKRQFIAQSVAALVVDLSVAEGAPMEVDDLGQITYHAIIIYNKEEMMAKGWYGEL